MDEQERLYALALRLVPDVDVAGDIFMDARDEADLLRRANRWRRQQSLPEISAPPPVSPLSDEEREYAYHLARRGRRRRRLMPLSGVTAIAVLGMFVVLVGFRGLVKADQGLALDPAYRSQPVAATDRSGLQFAVYKVEATPGSATIWWSVQGRNAAREAAGLELQLHDIRLATRIRHETAIAREDRVVGQTTFRIPLPITTQAGLSATSGGGRPGWYVPLVMNPEPDPGARTIAVNQSITGMSGQVRVTVLSVTAARDYTIVRVRPEGEDYQVAMASHMELVAGGTPMPRYGAWRGYPELDDREILYGPLPADISSLELLFPRLAEQDHDEIRIAVTLRP
ncbi:MAG TPA: hypothetical protein VNT75_27685 [Symbiobacteriaceae bacterium]|nr:hypothetical protein [Symbiobacteriaceae bacterium]